ncbi:hypothetical protein XCR_1239 [Xanthomonas campestris pv. raphani 756C]|nr:hypothetical protein XCR_1239 [Xanthomonas campestris pv. raphani 756C]
MIVAWLAPPFWAAVLLAWKRAGARRGFPGNAYRAQARSYGDRVRLCR